MCTINIASITFCANHWHCSCSCAQSILFYFANRLYVWQTVKMIIIISQLNRIIKRIIDSVFGQQRCRSRCQKSCLNDRIFISLSMLTFDDLCSIISSSGPGKEKNVFISNVLILYTILQTITSNQTFIR